MIVVPLTRILVLILICSSGLAAEKTVQLFNGKDLDGWSHAFGNLNAAGIDRTFGVRENHEQGCSCLVVLMRLLSYGRLSNTPRLHLDPDPIVSCLVPGRMSAEKEPTVVSLFPTRALPRSTVS